MSAAVTIPARRSLAFFAALAVILVVVSYVLLFALAVGCVYLPFLILGHDSSLQSLALFVAGVIISGSMLWSMVPRRNKFVAPGLLLDRTAHPRLFAEIDHIASALQEPLPREVYLIGEPNAWVADRGGILGLRSRRVMGLGLPLLAVLDIAEMRAILAHEFAHYYGGDTRLGPWLRRAQLAMLRTLQSMASVGKAMRLTAMQILYMLVFAVVKWYWLLFLRAINFVSRRQEFRADELAAIIAGPQPLVSGLRKVRGAALAWPVYWNTEMAPMLSSGFLPSIAGGFSLFLAAPHISKQVEEGVEKDIRERKTQPYDSHPPLRDRIAAAQAMQDGTYTPDTDSAVSLLKDSGAAELAFLQSLNPNLPKDSLKPVSWQAEAETVRIPAWSSFVNEYASLLERITVGTVPEALGRIREIAPHIRDPKGMLLTPEQRVERARALLAMAFGLALVRCGWSLHCLPGELYLERDGKQLQPFDVINQLSAGTISPAAWMATCNELATADVLLIAAASKASVG